LELRQAQAWLFWLPVPLKGLQMELPQFRPLKLIRAEFPQQLLSLQGYRKQNKTVCITIILKHDSLSKLKYIFYGLFLCAARIYVCISTGSYVFLCSSNSKAEIINHVRIRIEMLNSNAVSSPTF
jgi:hypothetical protein